MRDNWIVSVDRGDGSEMRVTEHDDMEHIYRRIGQIVLSTGMEQIIVYNNGEEYRRYELKHKKTEEENE